ncbi:hypothetical protein AB4Y45_32190 [Paraburkholderia sp. EG287A]|uniref:hypothetical protein n=1 Tax=Paraburkholderia sp. EG287A TaxID=3237012 RepID=UPI0034D1DA18
MKNQCSLSNLFAAIASFVAYGAKWGVLIVALFMAAIGLMVAFLGGFLFVTHKPVVFGTDRVACALYGLSAASWLGFLVYGLWTNWRETLSKWGAFFAKIAAAFVGVWYLCWVGTVVPTALDHPSTLFVGIHQPLWVHFALVPIQICLLGAALCFAFAALAGLWCGIAAMCKHGAELREAKAKAA